MPIVKSLFRISCLAAALAVGAVLLAETHGASAKGSGPKSSAHASPNFKNTHGAILERQGNSKHKEGKHHDKDGKHHDKDRDNDHKHSEHKGKHKEKPVPPVATKPPPHTPPKSNAPVTTTTTTVNPGGPGPSNPGGPAGPGVAPDKPPTKQN
jgi:hypothetical protein